MTVEQYDAWAIDNISHWKTRYPHWADNYYMDKNIYWYVPMGHNVEVLKREKWFLGCRADQFILGSRMSHQQLAFGQKRGHLLAGIVEEICLQSSK